jgi:site-specific DNA-methyltransferase (adenine-specific)
MNPAIDLQNAKVFFGSCLDVLPTFADNSVDAIVTDPPYELGFMGKSWDNSGIAYNVDVWRECLRVLKPGGHILAFGGSRTWHRLAVAIEDAGFEMRDSIAWLYGSGFPKSHNISKAIDKLHGAEREVIGQTRAGSKERKGFQGDMAIMPFSSETIDLDITASATDDAKAWDGWGTALKPAFEPIVVGRKPLVGTVAENVLEWGVGGLNIDATRIDFASEQDRASATPQGRVTSNINAGAAPDVDDSGRREVNRPDNSNGRWPANIILDEYTAELLDEQSNASRFFKIINEKENNGTDNQAVKEGNQRSGVSTIDGGGIKLSYGAGESFGDSSNFFYVAKASKKDRNEGLNELPEVRHADRNVTDGVGGDNPRNRTNKAKQNFHPTVKPTALMQYLVRLVTPEGGTVLDPFTGSGSTGKAAILENKLFIGIELTEEYLPIIAGRLEHAISTSEKQEGDDLFADL